MRLWFLRVCALWTIFIGLRSDSYASANNIFAEPRTQAETACCGIAFDAISVKRHPNNGDGWRYQYRPSGFVATAISMRDLIAEAYGVADLKRIVGLPPWANEEGYDVEAKVSAEDAAAWQSLSLEQKRKMLQGLLHARFNLSGHNESQVFSVLALSSTGGPVKLHDSSELPSDTRLAPGTGGKVKRSQAGLLSVEHFDMSGFASMLTWIMGRPVVDETTLTGRYDFDLRWEQPGSSTSTGSEPATAQSDSSIYTALKEQMGLQLTPKKAPLNVLMIDHVEKPLPN